MGRARNLFGYLEASAASLPDAAAVEDSTGSLGYAELLDRARRVAATLHGLDLGPGDRVGLVLDKSLDAVVGLHGILAAGAAYVPVDARQPLERVRAILQDCDIRVVISGQAELARLGNGCDLGPVRTVLCLGERGTEVAPRGTEVAPRGTEVVPALAREPLNAPCPAAPDDLAYVLYTSGSTGQPKGVMLSNRAAISFVDWAVEELNLGPEDRLASQAALTFDLSILDLFGASASGACVCLVPDEMSLLPRALAEWLQTSRISVLYSVPWVFIQLLTRGRLEQRNLDALRLALFAGEVFPVKHLSELMTRWPGARFYNLFGPTETNVCSFYAVTEIPDPDGEPVPMGRPCSGDVLHVLDDSGNPLPDNQEGELVVAGPSLLDGYWGDAKKTAAALIDLTVDGTVQRAFRTGDRVMRRRDGSFVYLGRRDRMIKRRGFRIELGEIEVALVAHPDLEEGVVIAAPGDQTAAIRAFGVPRAARRPGMLEIKSFLSGRIPRYMIPDSFELLEALPRTATGKIDRRRLSER